MSTLPFGVVIDLEFVRSKWIGTAVIPTGPKRFDRILVGYNDNLSDLVEDMEGLGVITYKGVQYDVLSVLLSDLARLLLGKDPEAWQEWSGEVVESLVDC